MPRMRYPGSFNRSDRKDMIPNRTDIFPDRSDMIPDRSDMMPNYF